jgi:16S rRNA G966 N2-methylase RsmD
VEENAETVKCLRQNLEYCKLAGTVHQSDVLTWLETQNEKAPSYDLIFADPPYIKEVGSGAFDLPWSKLATFLAPGGLMVWEHSSGRTSAAITGWEVTREKRYGETTLTFLRPLDKNPGSILRE